MKQLRSALLTGVAKIAAPEFTEDDETIAYVDGRLMNRVRRNPDQNEYTYDNGLITFHEAITPRSMLLMGKVHVMKRGRIFG